MDESMRVRLIEVELEILEEIDRICEKHSIPYYLDYGSALGAVRSGGVIPWDDDIDIGMLRDDYIHFLEVVNNEINQEKFFVQTHESEPDYHKFHAKIRKKDTLYPQIYTTKFKERGIMLDIFPMDYVPNDINKRNRMQNKTRKFRWLCAVVTDEYQKRNLIKRIIVLILRIIPESCYRTKYENMCQKYNIVKTDYVACFSDPYAMKRNISIRVADLLPTKKVKFEDGEYSIMNNPDSRLTGLYGDYMKLPPEEERVPHHVCDVIFCLSKKE